MQNIALRFKCRNTTGEKTSSLEAVRYSILPCLLIMYESVEETGILMEKIISERNFKLFLKILMFLPHKNT